MFLFYPNVKIVKEDYMFYICVSQEIVESVIEEIILSEKLLAKRMFSV